MCPRPTRVARDGAEPTVPRMPAAGMGSRTQTGNELQFAAGAEPWAPKRGDPRCRCGGRCHTAHTLGPPPRSERGRTAGEARTRLTSDPPPGLTRRRAERRAVARPGSPELSNVCWVVTSAHVLVLGGRVDTRTPRRLASLTCQAREMP